MSDRFKVLISVSAFFILIMAVLGAIQLKKEPALPPLPPEEEEKCVKAETKESMALSDAKEIALTSECVREGGLTEEYFCNEYTGTWWLDLTIEKEGCAPACVIDIITKEAEINWRCTGLIPE